MPVRKKSLKKKSKPYPKKNSKVKKKKLNLVRRKNKSLIKQSGGGKYTYYLYFHEDEYTDHFDLVRRPEKTQWYAIYTLLEKTYGSSNREYNKINREFGASRYKKQLTIKKFILNDVQTQILSDNSINSTYYLLFGEEARDSNTYIVYIKKTNEIQKLKIKVLTKDGKTFIKDIPKLLSGEKTFYEIDDNIFNFLAIRSTDYDHTYDYAPEQKLSMIIEVLFSYIFRKFEYNMDDEGKFTWDRNMKIDKIKNKMLFFKSDGNKTQDKYAKIILLIDEGFPHHFDLQKVKTFPVTKFTYQNIYGHIVNFDSRLITNLNSETVNPYNQDTKIEDLKLYLDDEFEPRLYKLNIFLIKVMNQLPLELEIIDIGNIQNQIDFKLVLNIEKITRNLDTFNFLDLGKLTEKPEPILQQISNAREQFTPILQYSVKQQKVKEILGNF